MPESTLPDRIFVGDSEMARRTRGLDWSATAFGTLGRWPQRPTLSHIAKPIDPRAFVAVLIEAVRQYAK